MCRIKITAFVSLDGVMQAPGGPDEDTSGGFEYGGWTFPYFDEKTGGLMGEVFAKPFALLLGRKTYDIFAGYWPRAREGADQSIADPFNRAKKYVATRSNTPLAWNNSESLGPDVVARLREIKAGDGPDLLTQGSGDLIQTLLAGDLVDTVQVLIFPLLLGKGKRLFGDGIMPAAFRLAQWKVTPSGVIVATYERAGEIKTGDFGPPPQ